MLTLIGWSVFAGLFNFIIMKKLISLACLVCCYMVGQAQVIDPESLKRDPQRKMAPNRPVPRDSSTLFIVGENVYRSWDPVFQKIMRTELSDTSKYTFEYYINRKSNNAVKTVVIFMPKVPEKQSGKLVE